MPQTEIQEWLIAELSGSLASVFEAMAGQRPAVETRPLAEPPGKEGLYWRQPFSGIAGAVWMFAAEADWRAAGNEILRAAGIDDGDAPTIRSTYLETIVQALSTLAQSITGRLEREITASGGLEAQASSVGQCHWVLMRTGLAGGVADIAVGFEKELIEAFGVAAAAMIAPPAAELALAAAANSPARTFDLLLDVELPVSVSFGRAQVALKDVLKLTTGSIVELNRSITEPVEVIVNNCVIARGEVVVVEGNFGVRIQQVVSRQERLRTLN